MIFLSQFAFLGEVGFSGCHHEKAGGNNAETVKGNCGDVSIWRENKAVFYPECADSGVCRIPIGEMKAACGDSGQHTGAGVSL